MHGRALSLTDKKNKRMVPAFHYRGEASHIQTSYRGRWVLCFAAVVKNCSASIAGRTDRSLVDLRVTESFGVMNDCIVCAKGVDATT